ncbi:hypothetical protein [Pseudomonas sp. MBLB4136]|uniref:hypothetical protein n=1 Tax=Pseudomonas sp. MBLB4136 TaxID=3451558 RepID=UPI003F7502C3
MFESIDPKDLVFEDRLHCLKRFDPSPEGYPRNETDPFAPYFYCPYDMRIDTVYNDAVMVLDDFSTREVGEIREVLKHAIEGGKEKFIEHLRNAQPGHPEEIYATAAKNMHDHDKPGLLRQFPPESRLLSTGKQLNEHHVWAVFAVEEVAEALRLIDIPMFPSTQETPSASRIMEDMVEIGLKVELPTRRSEHNRLVRAAYRSRSNVQNAAAHLMYAAQHIQYAILLILTEHNKEKNKAEKIITAKRMAGLLELNSLKSATIDRAIAIAKELWKADAERQEYRVKDMAALVAEILEREGMVGLPSVERIKEWIKPVAPAYARLGGRRRNTP